MDYSAGACDAERANCRVDEMLQSPEKLPFLEQPVIELTTGMIVGVCGANWFTYAGERRLGFNYRFVRSARRKGYATEASEAILSVWSKSIHGEMLAMIRYDNLDSKRVAEKLGFDFLEMQLIDGTPYEIYRL